MIHKKILITGGAGFIGANLAVMLKKSYPSLQVFALDNLKRRGSELNLPRLKRARVEFIHGDVRCREDLFSALDSPKNLLLIECSAEPSVLAGVNSSPDYVINTNLVGLINCLEFARVYGADVLFLSTSRVYPVSTLNELRFRETKTRFELNGQQKIQGASSFGISENFPLNGYRSLYGATKLSGEHIIQEYAHLYKIRAIVNRCGLITGPWQMGKVDQGVVAYWLFAHIFKKELSFIGFNGQGKQVRDFLFIDDLYTALKKQIDNFGKLNGEIYNLGGGKRNSFSLVELTEACQKITGEKIKISSIKETRPFDVKLFISDFRKFAQVSGWRPKIGLEESLEKMHKWALENKKQLRCLYGF